MKRNNALVIMPISGGLKCDRPGCGYKTEGIRLTPKNVPGLIGTPCPQCGSNLLTEADAKSLMLLFRIAAVINFICFPYCVVRQILVWLRICKPGKWVRCRCSRMDGSGAMKFEKPVPMEDEE
jgi:hypothetical protein